MPQSCFDNAHHWQRMDTLRQLLHEPTPRRWVFLGDSITHGARHTLGWRDYTELFSERIRFELARSHDIVIKTGVSGWKISNVARHLDWHATQFTPAIISLMVGMNDCTLGQENLHGFRTTYRQVISQLREREATMLLLHTPNWLIPTGGPERIAHLPAYRAAILDLAAELQVPCIDHFALWQEAEQRGVLHHWLAHGCHPNEIGHRALAHTIFYALDIWDPTSWTCKLMVPEQS